MLGDAPTEVLEGDAEMAMRIQEYVAAAADAKESETHKKLLAIELGRMAEGYKKVVCPTGEKFTIVRREATEPKIVVAEFVGQKIQVKAGIPGTEFPGHFRVPKEATAE